MHGGQWTVAVDGILTGRNGVDWSTNPEKSGSGCARNRDFILELEYAINAKGQQRRLHPVRAREESRSRETTQILDDSRDEELKKWSTGALYDVVAANKVMSRPAGQWNTVRIEAAGPGSRFG